jgi:SAM-dependent methyltransferase
VSAPDLRAFRAAYAEQRRSEGRGAGGGAELLQLPYLRRGPLAKQWQVRARTFDHFLAHVVEPLAQACGRPLRVLDLGAGNGWLCYRLALLQHETVALDLRDDDVDGLSAASGYTPALPALFPRIAASFDALPLAARSFDLVVFNAALHYAVDLLAATTEAARVTRSGGRIAILDSPFYTRDRDGARMAQEKRARAHEQFGPRAEALLSIPSIEYLTRKRLEEAVALEWRRHRVRYPLWYELRPLATRPGQRLPSRFDIWEACIP